jgi:dolichol-phosphate mannosyltransferase
MPQVCVILPCLNEELALPPLLRRLAVLQAQLAPSFELQVAVVDDGCTDGTAAIAGAGVEGLLPVLLVHAQNRGLGQALQTGIGWFLNRPAAAEDDCLLVLDADGTHPPELLPQLLAALSSYDVVIASRYAPGGSEHGLSTRRRLLSRLASACLRSIAPVRGARDYTCGFRLYRAAVLVEARRHFGSQLLTERGFTCMAELLIKLARCGARIGEVPLELHYELKGGPSKMHVGQTIRRYAVLSWRLLFDPRFR